jgi:thiol-disulfide isomerase/thioredoxin
MTDVRNGSSLNLKRGFVMRIFAILLVLVASAFAQAKESPAPVKESAKTEELPKKAFKEGEHYVRLSTPVRTADPTKIEVTEVFWYGCGHCYAFEPELQKWRKNLPDDVLFDESPAIWRDNMATHARIFYTSKVLGVLDVMHEAVFEAIHIKKMKLERTEDIQTLYEQNGISGDAFKKAFEAPQKLSSMAHTAYQVIWLAVKKICLQ